RPPELIQAEIERTRSELDQTLWAIERKLAPRYVFSDVLTRLGFRGVTPEDVSSFGRRVRRVARAIRRHPMQAALVGVSVLAVFRVARVPNAVGALGMALGTVMGAALPSSRHGAWFDEPTPGALGPGSSVPPASPAALRALNPKLGPLHRD